MSISIGSGFVTAYIDQARMHKIRDSSSSPEMTLWEKIKDFFFSTHQREALDCIHKLYHHSSCQMSNRDLEETFLKLKGLASPKHQEKFIMTERNGYYSYKIAGEDIVSVPYDDKLMMECDGYSFGTDDEEVDERLFYDCHSDESSLHDCHGYDSIFDIDDLMVIWNQKRNIIFSGEASL